MGLYHQDNDCNRLWPDCIEYYRRFNTRFGSSKCRDITGIKFKEGYDIRRFLLKGMKCLRVVYTSIESIFDIVEMAERRSPSKGTYRVMPPFDTKKFHSFKTSLRVGMLYKKFVSQFGSADCIDILGKVSRSKKRDSCEEIARSTAQLALDLMSVKTFTFEAAK